MPNMFGGDQFHPAYDPRTEIKDNQIVEGNFLYTAQPDGKTASYEGVDGSTGTCLMPQALKDKIAKQGSEHATPQRTETPRP